jgi:hypothetical protein
VQVLLAAIVPFENDIEVEPTLGAIVGDPQPTVFTVDEETVI